jgi:hypothetical protein
LSSLLQVPGWTVLVPQVLPEVVYLSPRFKVPCRLYLAGRVSKPDWRETFFRTPELLQQGTSPGSLMEPGFSWPILPRVVLDTFDYVGPYVLQARAYGPSSHGLAASGLDWLPPTRQETPALDDRLVASTGGKPDLPPAFSAWSSLWDEIPPPDKARREKVCALCLQALRRADLVFAWIDSPTAYGTLVELGFAHALGRTIWLAGPTAFEDLWFGYQMATLTTFEQDTPLRAFTTLLKRAVQAA